MTIDWAHLRALIFRLARAEQGVVTDDERRSVLREARMILEQLQGER